MARSKTPVAAQPSRNERLTEAKLVELIKKKDGSVGNAARSALTRQLDRMADGWNIDHDFDELLGRNSNSYITKMERKRWGRSRVVLGVREWQWPQHV